MAIDRSNSSQGKSWSINTAQQEHVTLSARFISIGNGVSDKLKWVHRRYSRQFPGEYMDLTNVRVKEHCGIVTNETSTVQFGFLISPMKHRARVEKETYIILDHPILGDACQVIALVKEIKSYEEAAGTTISERLGKMYANAEILGYVDLREEDKPIRKMLVPPNPGSRVHMPYAEFLEDTFSRNTQGKPFQHALYMGKTESLIASLKGNVELVNYFLDAEDFTNRHTLIAAMNETGKTHTATVIIEELANKTKQPIVIMDPHGEYNTIGNPKKTIEQQNALSYQVQILTPNQEKISTQLQKQTPATEATAKTTINSIPAALNEKNEAEVRDNLTKAIKPGQVTTINAQYLTPEQKSTFYAQYMKALWKARLEKATPPFTLVVEDAEKMKNETLEAMAYEGTKHDIALIILAKHPTELGGRILAQMSTHIIGRIIDNDDLNYFKNITPKKAMQIPQLRQGEWIINSINKQQPTQVTVRGR